MGSRQWIVSLKFGCLLRFATEAWAQGAPLTLHDLAVLMGIHVDAIRRQLSVHLEVVMPTRGRVKDIGLGVKKKKRIVKLYLEMHIETEIVENNGNTYESVGAYLYATWRNTTTFHGTPGWLRQSSSIPIRSWMPKRNAVRFSGSGRGSCCEACLSCPFAPRKTSPASWPVKGGTGYAAISLTAERRNTGKYSLKLPLRR
ncbi:MAG TPA: DUF1670 domain-containing protein [Syntrophomonadaceae bacterium]|nr:DUF1670 domain-containing protein [Syntrophomonadaceae bacterium]